jgi:phosphoribosylpyrophosphate synthetase
LLLTKDVPHMTNWKLIAGDAHPGLAKAIAGELNVSLEAAEIARFADGETSVRIGADLRETTVFIVQPTAPAARAASITSASVTRCSDTGGAAQALRQSGAREVHALFTHAVMARDARERLLAAALDRIVTSDSVPVAEHPRFELVSVAPLLVKTVRELGGRSFR